jgi:hypothetical protein
VLITAYTVYVLPNNALGRDHIQPRSAIVHDSVDSWRVAVIKKKVPIKDTTEWKDNGERSKTYKPYRVVEKTKKY